MRRIEIREDDDSLFGNKLTTEVYNCFATYVSEIRKIVQQQPTGFWIAFVTSFRVYALKNYNLKDPKDIHFISLLKTVTDTKSVCDFYVIVEAVKRYCIVNRMRDGETVQEVKEDYDSNPDIPNVVILYIHFVTALVELYYRYGKAPAVRRKSSLAFWKPPVLWEITLEYPKGSYEDYLRQTWGTYLLKSLRIDKSAVPWLFAKTEDVSLPDNVSGDHDYDSEMQEMNAKVRGIYVVPNGLRTQNFLLDSKSNVYVIGDPGLFFNSAVEETKDELLQKKFRRRKKNKSRRNEIDCTINTVNSLEEMHLKSELFGSCDSFDNTSEESQVLKNNDNIVNKQKTKQHKVSLHKSKQFILNEKCNSTNKNAEPEIEFLGSKNYKKSTKEITEEQKINIENCDVSPKYSDQSTRIKNNFESQKTLIFHNTELGCDNTTAPRKKKENKKKNSEGKFSFSLDINPDSRQSANKKDDEKFQYKDNVPKSVKSKVNKKEKVSVADSSKKSLPSFEEAFSVKVKPDKMSIKNGVPHDVETKNGAAQDVRMKNGAAQDVGTKNGAVQDGYHKSEKKVETIHSECKNKKKDKINGTECIKRDEKPENSKTKSAGNKLLSTESSQNSADKISHQKKSESGKNKKNKKKTQMKENAEKGNEVKKLEKSAKESIMNKNNVKVETVITAQEDFKKSEITSAVKETKVKNGFVSPKKEFMATCIGKKSAKNGIINLPIGKSDFDTMADKLSSNTAPKISSDMVNNVVEQKSGEEQVKSLKTESSKSKNENAQPKEIKDCYYEIIDLTVPQTSFKFPYSRNNIGPMLERISEDTMFTRLRDYANKRPKQNLWLLRKCDVCQELESEPGLWKRCFHCVQCTDTPRIYCCELCCSFDWDRGHSAYHTSY